MNQQNHRIIGAIGVPLVLFLLQFRMGFTLNLTSGALLVVGAIVGYAFGGGKLSPDIDYGHLHRNFFTHSTLIPYILVIAFSSVNYLYTLFVMVFIAWTLHVIVDYFSEGDEFAFEIDPTEWTWGWTSYILSWVIIIGTWLALFTITPFELLIP